MKRENKNKNSINTKKKTLTKNIRKKSIKTIDKITEDDLSGIIKIRYMLGKIFETVQYLEYNLSLNLHYFLVIKEMKKLKQPITQRTIQLISSDVDKKLKDDKVDLQTFGNLISTLSINNVLDKKDLDELEDLLKTRNFLVHQYFKKNKFENQKENPDFLNDQINYLSHIQNRILNFNNKIYAQLNYLGNQINKVK